MCGIVGLVAAQRQRPVPVEQLERAVHALRHRGPDSEGAELIGAAALGHTRLAIIDPEQGHQPMRNEDRSVVAVYNGEIWNHRDLRRELEAAGHVFRTHADTEVLVHGFEEWGEGLPERLDGMFAFAIWDARRERLLVARDRLGKKPLFIARMSEGLAFGSDARSVLLVSGLRPELDVERLPAFLFQRYVSAPQTMFSGIDKVPPGHLLTYDRSTAAIRPYWRLDLAPPGPLRAEELRELLRDSVRRRLMSDVPLGVLLSGGVDSAAVLGLMREAGADSIASFTVGYDDPLYDERGSARIVAERFGSDHHELSVDGSDFLDALPRLAWLRDEPIAEPREIPLLLLAELAGRYVKVVLTGDGGDELFAGYPKYRAEQALAEGGALAARALGAMARLRSRRPSHRRMRRAAETFSFRDPLLRRASWFRSFSPAELGRLLAPDLRPAIDAMLDPLRGLMAPHQGLNPVHRMLVADLLTWLPDNMLIRGDRVLMAASVEGRTPLLDRRVVERVSSLPPSIRMSLRSPKLLLREAVADLVPAEVFQAPKRGFPVPVASFLFSDRSRALERLVLSDRCIERGLFEPDEVRALVAGERSYRTDRELKLFTLASLELWLRTSVDELRTEPPDGLEGTLDAPAHPVGVAASPS
jgi:asparagine synthase (glutamine-hydrolysing)